MKKIRTREKIRGEAVRERNTTGRSG